MAEIETIHCGQTATVNIDRDNRTVEVFCEQTVTSHGWRLVLAELEKLGAVLDDAEPVYERGVDVLTARF
jgi:hypothetical protein